ncbi:unnamed protein product [Aphanomyces euteiches]|nr:hypothetical protein Ae201684P_019032 [Aphanomyces euteiches]
MSQNQDAPTTRLPDIYASPGNVGVQIDSYRAKNMFHRPRCNTFTTTFHGHMFQDHTLKNAKRMLARELQRKRDEEERMKKLAEYQEQRLLAKVQLEEKRKHREYLRRQRAWEEQQAVKAESQRALERASVIKIQSLHRGNRVRKRIDHERQAAISIQVHIRRFAAQKEFRTRERARDELKSSSAIKIQAHVRRRQSMLRVRAMRSKLSPEGASDSTAIEAAAIQSAIPSLPPPSSEELPKAIGTKETEARSPDPVHFHKPTPPNSRKESKPELVLKRVGGGFRRIIKPREDLKVLPSPLPLSRSPANTPTKRIGKPQTPRRSFIQQWNEVEPPVAKSLETFIHDPNLAEKLKYTPPLRPLNDPSLIYRNRDANALCTAMDESFPIAECFDNAIEALQQPLAPSDADELCTAMRDMVALDDTVPECFDEKPPSRPEVATPASTSIFQWMPSSVIAPDGEWVELLDADLDVKVRSLNASVDPIDDRIELCSSRPEQQPDEETLPVVKRLPKSILKKALPEASVSVVVTVGSQYSLRKPTHVVDPAAPINFHQVDSLQALYFASTGCN